MVGFIKLHRKLQQWEWYNKSEMVHLFIHLLINANSEDGEWQKQPIKRGQLITGLHSLSEKTGISIRTIRTCLGRLKSTNELTIKSTNKFSVITICKYDDYNDNKKKTDKQIDSLPVTPTTTNKKLKNKEDNIYRENPTLDEFIKYFDENNFNSELATRAWKGYSENNWKDSNGKVIKNWKSKCQHVWFSEINSRYKKQVQQLEIGSNWQAP